MPLPDRFPGGVTVVVLGIDALDPDLVSRGAYPNLSLDHHRSIGTIVSASGEPSTHELWPSIITGLPPAEHGLVLGEGVGWSDPWIRAGSRLANGILPDGLRTLIGAWLLNNTSVDTFRTPVDYYEDRGIDTVFDDRRSCAIGIPNYVRDLEHEDREHQLRSSMGDLFERDPDAESGHRSSDPREFYERCMEMAMVRTARVRRAVRSRRFELVFGYTSALDLIGHVAYDEPAIQKRAYDEMDDFVGDLVRDLDEDDVLILVSDHGLQGGLHTDAAMIASDDERVVVDVESVLDVREAVEVALNRSPHEFEDPFELYDGASETGDAERVRSQLEDLGYL